MKRLPMFSRQPDVADVHDVRDAERRSWFNSPRPWVLGAVAIVAIAAASWWIYPAYVKPALDQRRVDDAVMLLKANPSGDELLREAVALPGERRLIELAALFRAKKLGIPMDQGLKASRSALDLAIHKGSREARLELGKALRNGNLGDKDLRAAAAQFQLALDELQPGIKSGDQDSLYVYSLMLKDGLGVDADPKKAREILKRVALSRDYQTMTMIGIFALDEGEGRDLELAKAISRKLIESGRADAYFLGGLACSKEYALNEQMNLARMEVQSRLRERCELPFLRLAADKGDKDAIAELATMTSDRAELATPIRPRPTTKAQSVDPETQSRTGYLNGTRQLAEGGLSTFKIDNTKGGGDVVVRLYRDGKKPAARSMFVKKGESFTAQAVAPGAYRLRYRYIGGADTFEAEQTFTLSETPTGNGTRFSRVTVTLYKVANGNMPVKKVNASEF